MLDKVAQHTSLECHFNYFTNIKLKEEQYMENEPWGCSPYRDSVVSIYKIMGRKRRTPGKYGEDSNEFFHKSVAAWKEGIAGYATPDLESLQEDTMGTIEECFRQQWEENRQAGRRGSEEEQGVK